MRKSLYLALHLAFGAAFCLSPTSARAQQDDESDRGDGERVERRGRGDDRRRGDRRDGWGDWREQRERMRNATPDQRREMRTDLWVGMLARNYDLTDEQRAQVRSEVVKMNDERRAAMGDDAKTMDELRDKMEQFWLERGDDGDRRNREGDRGDPWENPEFREVAQQLRELEQKYPMNWEEGAERIESLLPADQVAKGRERRQQWMDRRRDWQRRDGETDDDYRERMRTMRQQLETARDQGRERFSRNRREERPAREGDRPAQEGEARLAREGEARLAREGEAPAEPQSPQGPKPPESQAKPAESKPVTPVASPAPPHPWDVWTDAFIAEHKLDRSQTASAMGILKSLKDREAVVRKAQTADRAALAKAADSEAKTKRLKELDAPIDALFKELQSRVNGLLTAEQRREKK